ncbi:MAG: glycosyltransferase [Patescibacteria group bacterium]
MENKRILILYAPLGAGHETAAKAIEEAFAQNYPEFEVKTADVLDFAFEIFRQTLPRAFVFFSSKIPFLYKWIYDGFNHQSRYNFLNRASDAFIKKSKFVEFINEFNPDFILSTNPLPMQLVSLTKHKKIIDILSANVCTDFGFHSLWYNKDVNYYFIANEDIKKALIEHGVAENKIVITGIPASSKFSEDTDSNKILESFNFKNDTPTLLIIGGKIKCKVIQKIIKKVQEKNKAQFIIVAGRDKKLKKELKKSDLKKNKNIKIFGFVDNLQDHMSVSNLILTKAGGLTVAECMQKNLPMVINDFIPGQEEDNVKYIVERGAGIEAKNTRGAIKIINDLFVSPEKIAKMKENCKKIAKPGAAKELADFVAKVC